MQYGSLLSFFEIKIHIEYYSHALCERVLAEEDISDSARRCRPFGCSASPSVVVMSSVVRTHC